MELYGGFIPTVISKNDIQMLLADNILLIRLWIIPLADNTPRETEANNVKITIYMDMKQYSREVIFKTFLEACSSQPAVPCSSAICPHIVKRVLHFWLTK